MQIHAPLSDHANASSPDDQARVFPSFPALGSLLRSFNPLSPDVLPHSVDAALLAALTPVINHVLVSDAAACRTLSRSAGKSVSVVMAPFCLEWQITAAGLLQSAAQPHEEADERRAADGNITLLLADLPKILQDTAHAMSYVRIAGDAELASQIGQIAQSVRWDAEGDLARLVGDIAAVRLVSGTKTVFGALRDSVQRVTQAGVEYLTEEKPVLSTHWQMETFRKDIVQMRDDTERLLKRFDKLKAKVKV